MKAHEGGLNLSSQPGKGTVFNLYFPCHTITPQEKVEVAAELSASGGARILVIDDEDVVGQTTREILVSLGYQTCFINDGQNAIEHFKKNKDQYDLVILDVEMPGMLGWDIFKELKKINPEIRCLFCSGYCIENQAQHIKDEGVCGFLQKPFRMSEISKVVSILLNS